MSLTDSCWDRFLTDLKSGNCCLLLGPELNCIPQDDGTFLTVQDAFSAFLKEKLDADQVNYELNEKNFHYRASKLIASRYPNDAQKFNTEISEFSSLVLNKIPPLFQNIAKLPFRSIANMVPDTFINRALNELGYYFIEDYYDYSIPAKEKPELEDELQLLYHIFGSYHFPSSVAITEKEQLKQIKEIVSGTPAIPDNVIARFKDKNKSFLFLGFNFNDWHFRLIMDNMKIPRPKASYYPLSNNREVAFITKEFYSDNFGIDFLQSETEDFVNELLDRYVNKYGNMQNMTVMLDYHDIDQEYFDILKMQLKISCNNRNFNLVDKNSIQPGDNATQKIEDFFADAKVYIPFISSNFLLDAASKKRIDQALVRNDLQTVLINTDYVDYQGLLGSAVANTVILPKHKVVLSEKKRDNSLSKTCFDLSRIINSIIR